MTQSIEKPFLKNKAHNNSNFGIINHVSTPLDIKQLNKTFGAACLIFFISILNQLS